MSSFAPADKAVYLLFGKTGWIGGKLTELLTEQGKTFHLADSRTYNREDVIAEIDRIKPTHVLNAAGVTGRPNVDWSVNTAPLIVFVGRLSHLVSVLYSVCIITHIENFTAVAATTSCVQVRRPQGGNDPHECHRLPEHR